MCVSHNIFGYIFRLWEMGYMGLEVMKCFSIRGTYLFRRSGVILQFSKYSTAYIQHR